MPISTVVLLAVLGTVQDKTVYRDDRLGLQFEHPKTWKVRKERQGTSVSIPLPDGQSATLMIYAAKFKGGATDWQLIQADINRSLKRTLVKQWQEDYLGVPMLFTKASYEAGGKGVTSLVGLLYTSFEEKMHFRLESPTEQEATAEASWKEALLTLRTTTGDLPAPEDPNKPSVKPEPPKPTTIWKPEAAPKKPVRGSNILEIAVGESKFRLGTPSGWTLSTNRLGSKSLKGSLTITVAIGLPEDAGQALLAAARDGMAEFQSVTLREDPKPEYAASGAVVGRVVRTGTTAQGQLVLGHFVGYCEGLYWSATYRTTQPEFYAHDKSVLADLLRVLYADRA